MSTRVISWGKGGRCVWLTIYHPCNIETSRKSVALTYPEPLGPPRPVAEDLYLFYLIQQNLPKTERDRSDIFFRFHRFPFYKGLCFNKTKYKKYDRLGLQ